MHSIWKLNTFVAQLGGIEYYFDEISFFKCARKTTARRIFMPFILGSYWELVHGTKLQINGQVSLWGQLIVKGCNGVEKLSQRILLLEVPQ